MRQVDDVLHLSWLLLNLAPQEEARGCHLPQVQRNCLSRLSPSPPVAIVAVVTVIGGGNFLRLVDHIGRSFAQWCYPVPPGPAREAAPLILCSVVNTAAAPALP